MFTRLIASRPTLPQDHGGLALSVAIHGSIIAALLLTAPVVTERIRVAATPIPVYLPPRAPVPPTVAQRAPAAPVTTASLPQLPSVPAIVAPSAIPTVIPPPTIGPWTPPSPSTLPGSAPHGYPTGTALTLHSGDTPLTGDEVDRPVRLRPRSPKPDYPAALRGMGITGGVRIRFVVDTLGRVEREGIVVLESSHPAFEAAVRATLPRLRFSPATVGPKAVRQLVEFPIVFTLDP